MSKITFFECSKCGEKLAPDKPATVCPKDGGVLYARYDLAALKGKVTPASLAGRRSDLWRYAEVLPDVPPVSLGEGFTPMLASHEYKNVYVKDEGLNPTGSFKARGLCVAVTMAKALQRSETRAFGGDVQLVRFVLAECGVGRTGPAAFHR